MQASRREFILGTLLAIIAPWLPKPKAQSEREGLCSYTAAQLAEHDFDPAIGQDETALTVIDYWHDFDPATYFCKKCGLGEYDFIASRKIYEQRNARNDLIGVAYYGGIPCTHPTPPSLEQ
jgi:hypothetical protein